MQAFFPFTGVLTGPTDANVHLGCEPCQELGVASVSLVGILLGVQGPPWGDTVVCPRRALSMEVCSRYCLLYIIYLVLIYNCVIARGS